MSDQSESAAIVEAGGKLAESVIHHFEGVPLAVAIVALGQMAGFVFSRAGTPRDVVLSWGRAVAVTAGRTFGDGPPRLN